jgi:hypothetical protein
MRRLFFLLAILAGTAGIGTRAQAQNYPWCATLNMGDSAYNCGFVSREQCMASVNGIGGFCQPNNTYRPPFAATRPAPQSRWR